MNELLTIKDFAKKAGLSYFTAFRLSKCEDFLSNQITVKVTSNNKKGGYRINYEKFMRFAERGDFDI